MEFNLKEGTSLIKETKVTENETAIKIGSGDLEVYSTPSMIAFMENTAKNSVTADIPDGYTTAGINMNVNHIKASPVGANITCNATLIKIDGKKLFFNVEANDANGTIGNGSHIRFIVNADDFMKRIQGK